MAHETYLKKWKWNETQKTNWTKNLATIKIKENPDDKIKWKLKKQIAFVYLTTSDFRKAVDANQRCVSNGISKPSSELLILPLWKRQVGLWPKVREHRHGDWDSNSSSHNSACGFHRRHCSTLNPKPRTKSFLRLLHWLMCLDNRQIPDDRVRCLKFKRVWKMSGPNLWTGPLWCNLAY